MFQNGERMNPFLSAYSTPFGIPPFEEIKPEHILPAFEQGLQEEIAEYYSNFRGWYYIYSKSFLSLEL